MQGVAVAALLKWAPPFMTIFSMADVHGTGTVFSQAIAWMYTALFDTSNPAGPLMKQFFDVLERALDNRMLAASEYSRIINELLLYVHGDLPFTMAAIAASPSAGLSDEVVSAIGKAPNDLRPPSLLVIHPDDVDGYAGVMALIQAGKLTAALAGAAAVDAHGANAAASRPVSGPNAPSSAAASSSASAVVAKGGVRAHSVSAEAIHAAAARAQAAGPAPSSNSGSSSSGRAAYAHAASHPSAAPSPASSSASAAPAPVPAPPAQAPKAPSANSMLRDQAIAQYAAAAAQLSAGYVVKSHKGRPGWGAADTSGDLDPHLQGRLGPAVLGAMRTRLSEGIAALPSVSVADTPMPTDGLSVDVCGLPLSALHRKDIIRVKEMMHAALRLARGVMYPPEIQDAAKPSSSSSSSSAAAAAAAAAAADAEAGAGAGSLPPELPISDSAAVAVSRCLEQFVQFVTAEAMDSVEFARTGVIDTPDLLRAMHRLGFTRYVRPCAVYMHLANTAAPMASVGAQPGVAQLSVAAGSGGSLLFPGMIPPSSSSYSYSPAAPVSYTQRNPRGRSSSPRARKVPAPRGSKRSNAALAAATIAAAAAAADATAAAAVAINATKSLAPASPTPAAAAAPERVHAAGVGVKLGPPSADAISAAVAAAMAVKEQGLAGASASAMTDDVPALLGSDGGASSAVGLTS